MILQRSVICNSDVTDAMGATHSTDAADAANHAMDAMEVAAELLIACIVSMASMIVVRDSKTEQLWP